MCDCMRSHDYSLFVVDSWLQEEVAVGLVLPALLVPM
jgi:hypothetical protein